MQPRAPYTQRETSNRRGTEREGPRASGGSAVSARSLLRGLREHSRTGGPATGPHREPGLFKARKGGALTCGSRSLKRPAAIAQHHPKRAGPASEGTKNIGTGWALTQRKEPFNRTLLLPRPPFLLSCHRAFSPCRKPATSTRESLKAQAPWSTGGTPGNGKRHRQLRSGHLGGQSPERSRSTTRLTKIRARAHAVREGYAPRRVYHPPPARGKRAAKQ